MCECVSGAGAVGMDVVGLGLIDDAKVRHCCCGLRMNDEKYFHFF